MNGSFDNYMSNFINDTSGDSMGRFNMNYNEIFNEPLEPNSVYVLTVIPTNNPGELLIWYSYLHEICGLILQDLCYIATYKEAKWKSCTCNIGYSIYVAN